MKAIGSHGQVGTEAEDIKEYCLLRTGLLNLADEITKSQLILQKIIFQADKNQQVFIIFPNNPTPESYTREMKTHTTSTLMFMWNQP